MIRAVLEHLLLFPTGHILWPVLVWRGGGGEREGEGEREKESEGEKRKRLEG